MYGQSFSIHNNSVHNGRGNELLKIWIPNDCNNCKEFYFQVGKAVQISANDAKLVSLNREQALWIADRLRLGISRSEELMVLKLRVNERLILKGRTISIGDYYENGVVSEVSVDLGMNIFFVESLLRHFVFLLDVIQDESEK
jgi:hypothetical protein